jgi:hypothetical protein
LEVSLSAVATLTASGVTVFLGITGFLFKWLQSSFNHLYNEIHLNREEIQQNREERIKQLADHDKVELEHHIQNLNRFEAISIALAKLGVDNGRPHI